MSGPFFISQLIDIFCHNHRLNLRKFTDRANFQSHILCISIQNILTIP